MISEEEDCESDRKKMKKKGLTAAVTGRTDINYHLSRRMEISEHVCYNLHICSSFWISKHVCYNLCMFFFLNELLRSELKNRKKVKKHYDHIRSTSIKNAPRGAWSSRGKDDVEMKFAVWRLLFRFSLFPFVSHKILAGLQDVFLLALPCTSSAHDAPEWAGPEVLRMWGRSVPWNRMQGACSAHPRHPPLLQSCCATP